MTRITKYFLTFILLAGSVIAYGQEKADTVLSLQQCIDIAIKNNLQVRQSDRTAQSANIDFRQAKEYLLPNIGAGAQRTFFNGRGISPVTNAYVNQSSTGDSYSASATITLFNGFALINAVKSTSYAYQAGKMDFQAAKDIVVVNVVTSYLNILDAQELLSAAKTALDVQQQTLDRTNLLEQQGANKAASDITDQKGQLEGNKVSVVNAQNNLDAARLSLFQLMNIPYQGQTKFEPLNAQDLTGGNGSDPNAMYQTALQQFAAIKAATLHREAAEKNVSSLRGNLFPTLTLGGGVSTAYSSAAQSSVVVDTTTFFRNIPYNNQLKNNYNSQIYLSLNIPIFSNGYRRNNLSRAKLNLLNAKDVENNTKVVLKQDIEQSYHNMQAAYNRYNALVAQVKAYTDSYRIYKLRYDSGVITSVELIVAKNNLESATYNMITAKYDYFINSRILDYYQGKLTSF